MFCCSNESWHRLTAQTGGHAVDSAQGHGDILWCCFLIIVYVPTPPHPGPQSKQLHQEPPPHVVTVVFLFSFQITPFGTVDAVKTSFRCGWSDFPICSGGFADFLNNQCFKIFVYLSLSNGTHIKLTLIHLWEVEAKLVPQNVFSIPKKSFLVPVVHTHRHKVTSSKYRLFPYCVKASKINHD